MHVACATMSNPKKKLKGMSSGGGSGGGGGDGDGGGGGKTCSSRLGGGISPLCIIHCKDSKSENFTYLSDCSEPGKRLEKLQNIAEKRLAQPYHSVHRMVDVSSKVPQAYSEQDNHNYGYHRDCYQKFTGNLTRLNKQVADHDEAGPSAARPKRNYVGEKSLFGPECVICEKCGDKKEKKGHIWTHESTTVFEYGGGNTVLEVVNDRADFDMLRKIQRYDLFACEAKYHPSSRKAYAGVCNIVEKHCRETFDSK